MNTNKIFDLLYEVNNQCHLKNIPTNVIDLDLLGEAALQIEFIKLYFEQNEIAMKNTIQAYVEIDLDNVRSDDFYKNRKKYGTGKTCIICGKPIKYEHTAKQVHLLENGHIVSTREDINNSQGFHLVGSDCAKRLIIKFAF